MNQNNGQPPYGHSGAQPAGGYGGPPQGYGPPQGHPNQQGPGGQWQNQQWQPQPPPKKNWFARHKVLTGLLAVLLIGIVIATTQSGSKKSGNASTPASAGGASQKSGSGGSSDGPTAGSSAAPVPLGKPVRDGKFEFTVTQVERGKKTVGQQFMQETAQGQYTLVHVTVKNIGTEQQSLSDSDQKALDENGTQYTPDTGADLAVANNNQVLFTQINPGNQVSGVIVYDAPVGKKLTKIELHDSFLSGGAYAAL